jgi:hypothetical protein
MLTCAKRLRSFSKSAPDEIGGKLMKRSYTPALAIGIGAVAGLRALTAPAVLAWAAPLGVTVL